MLIYAHIQTKLSVMTNCLATKSWGFQ